MSRLAAVLCGLLLGAALRTAGFARREGVLGAAGLASRVHVRVWLDLLGLGMLLSAALCWLAVIDVDRLRFLPLTGDLLLCGALFGTAVGVCGYLPLTSLAGIGGGRLTESLCAALGCVLGALLGARLPGAPLAGLFPAVPGTLFRLTLRDPWLLGGGFSALACLGVLLCVLSLPFRLPRGPAPYLLAAQPASAQADDTPDAQDAGSAADTQTSDSPAAADGPSCEDLVLPPPPKKRPADARPSVLEELADAPDPDEPSPDDETADLLDGAPPSPSDVFIPPLVYDEDDDDPDDD